MVAVVLSARGACFEAAMQERRMEVWLAMAETTQPPALQSRW